MRVLVVEDSLTSREVVCGLLGQQGHETIAVESGEQALEAFAAQAFDLVLMDVELPGMSGPDAAAAIRRQNRRVPILAMTAHTSDEQRERCACSGSRLAREHGFSTDPPGKKPSKYESSMATTPASLAGA